MNDLKIIKKIFNLAYYDFTQNFTNWLSITFLHAVFCILAFSGLSFVARFLYMSSWAWSSHLFFDWGELLYIFCNVYEFSHFYWMGRILAIMSVVFCLLFPVVIIQNCLDLAFDSKMRGISFSGPIASYFLFMVCCYGIFVTCVNLFSYSVALVFFYLPELSLLLHIFFIHFLTFIISFIVLYGMQYMYLVAMHILEYKKGMYASIEEIGAITKGKTVLLSKMLLLHLLTITFIFTLFYFCLGFVYIFFMPFLMVIFDIWSVQFILQSMYIFYNFVYLWAYILLFTWFFLVTAHVYRELICPPIDNVSCQSCSSCQ